MLVFRVELPVTGGGPYNSEWWAAQDRMCDAHSWTDDHPSPQRDPSLGWVAPNEKCATDSPGALLAWFAGFWNDLHAAGFVVSIREAKEARVGRAGQVVYYAGAAPEVGRYSAKDFLLTHA